jgi:hypothetical protein
MPLIPIEQLCADFLFERLDLNAERRLRDVQTQSGASKAQLLRHGDEIT